MKRHVALFSIPKYGHVIPALAVVRELVRRGHRVSFLTTGEFAGPVYAAGAEAVLYESTWPRSDEPAPEAEVPEDAAAWAPLIFLGEGKAAMAAAEQALADDRPDAVLFDATVSAPAKVLASKWGITGVQLYTTFATNDHFSMVDLAKNFFDEGTEEATHPALKLYHDALLELLAANGLRDVDVPGFTAASSNLSLVLLPRAFQYAGDTFDDHYVFVGACLDDWAGGRTWTPPADGRPVVLVAMGTMSERRPEFFRECVKAFEDQPWHVVIAVGEGVDPAEVGPTPPHIEVHRNVPQRAILERAVAFVSHSGMGSTMEAQYSGTPMVAVPQTPEQDLVAQRVAELGLGRLLPAGELTPQLLRDAVRSVTGDEGMRERIAAMRTEVREAGGAAGAVDALEQHLRD